ncbi:hypothetical protein HN777_00270 [Candidatus Woesearchaeota archaeon]|jgi:hypothetical protein|nr:hypothetical protein [Candidatus Woesearchaeota archaeon]
MDKPLELKVIETGYDPQKAEAIDLDTAAETIQNRIYPVSSRERPPALLFDGRVNAKAIIGKNTVIIDNDCLAVEGADNSHFGGLFVYSMRDGMWFRRSSVYTDRESDREHLTAEADKDGWAFDELKLRIADGASEIAKFEFMLHREDNIPILYLPRQGSDYQRLKRIWENIGEQTEVALSPQSHPRYLELFTGYEPKTGIGFVVGTDKDRSHDIVAVVPKGYPVESLNGIIKNLEEKTKQKLTLDAQDLQGGVKLSFQIPRGYGQDVADYMLSILEGAVQKIYPNGQSSTSTSKELVRLASNL